MTYRLRFMVLVFVLFIPWHIQLSQHHLWKGHPSSVESLFHFCKILLICMICMGSIMGPAFFLLTNVPVPLSIPPFLYYHRYTHQAFLHRQSDSSHVIHFVNIVFAALESVSFHINFRINLSMSTKNFLIFDRVYINTTDPFCDSLHIYNIESSKPQACMFFHLFGYLGKRNKKTCRLEREMKLFSNL